jgi:ribulose-phosphate 3-epimerase
VREVHVSASAWSADLGALRTSLAAAAPHCDSIHFDIMDNHFVPELLFGLDILAAVKPHVPVPFQAHMMMENPERCVTRYAPVVDTFLFHPGTCSDWPEIKRKIRGLGRSVGLALLLGEDWRAYRDDLAEVDVVLVMGTEVGIKGVDINSDVFAVISELREQIDAHGYSCLIQADGGIRRDTLPRLIAAGVDAITPGSLFFGSDFSTFRSRLRETQREVAVSTGHGGTTSLVTRGRRTESREEV